ncbi:hypothetical protein D9619_013283 [Psilocybe cf. subviscida]|uniref:Uncharacterized protein n=1 Tax=Psilocybe cf. subviscida TaxID=2480587 RepID=A0A8H5BU02_9AGAR|nr:hypothetical protein D9619_013283 [Psilocybe cf. subviscida]
MFFSTTSIALFVAILTQGVMAAPNGLVAITVAESTTPTITPTPQYTDATVHITPYTALTTGNGAVTKAVASNDIVLVIRTVTTVSNDINLALTKVTAQVTLADLTKIAAAAVQGFTQIVADIGKAVTMLPGTPVISGGVADTVVEVLVGFVKVHQALLNTVIGKHSIFAQFALTAPLAAVLRLIETGVDTFAFIIIGIIPTKKAIIQKEISGLDTTVKSSISVYSQICLPSLNFPKVMPTCIKLGL